MNRVSNAARNLWNVLSVTVRANKRAIFLGQKKLFAQCAMEEAAFANFTERILIKYLAAHCSVTFGWRVFLFPLLGSDADYCSLSGKADDPWRLYLGSHPQAANVSQVEQENV